MPVPRWAKEEFLADKERRAKGEPVAAEPVQPVLARVDAGEATPADALGLQSLAGNRAAAIRSSASAGRSGSTMWPASRATTKVQALCRSRGSATLWNSESLATHAPGCPQPPRTGRALVWTSRNA